MSKTKVCVLNKTKQKDEIYCETSACKVGNSRLWEQWVLGCSQTKEFLWDKCGSFWLFQLMRCLVVFFLDFGWLAESCEQESPEVAWKTWHRLGTWELAGVLRWFLIGAINSCKSDFLFTYSWLTWVDQLHFIPL